MALSQFTSEEQYIIRSYLLLEGEMPTQAQLNAAFDQAERVSGLREITNIEQQTSNSAFITSLYEAIGIDPADHGGFEDDGAGPAWWAEKLSSTAVTREQLAIEFADAARNSIDREFADEIGDAEGLAAGTRTEFNRVDPTDPEAPEERETFDVNLATDPSTGLGRTQITQEQFANTNDWTFSLTNESGTGPQNASFMSPIFNPDGGQAAGSRLTFNIYNQFAPKDDVNETLAAAQVNSVSFNYNGERYRLESEDISDASNYDELQDAIAAAIADNEALAGRVTVSAGVGFTTPQRNINNEDTGESVAGRGIVLSAREGSLTLPSVVGEAKEGEFGGVNFFPGFGTIPGQEGVIQTNLQLQNVGYISQGNSININGSSRSDLGIEQFNVQVQKGVQDLGVWLGALTSQTNVSNTHALQTIRMVEGSDASYFNVGTQDGYGMVGSAAADAGLFNVRQFLFGDFAGDVQINAVINNAVVARDIHTSTDQVDYRYETGSGDDRVILNVDGVAASYERFNLNIDTDSGNDYVHLNFTGAGWENNQAGLGNISIDAGNGSNVVWTQDAGEVTVTTGRNADVIYTDHWAEDGDASTDFDVVNDLLVTEFGTAPATDLVDNGRYFIPEGRLTVSFMGFEKEVNIPTTNNVATVRQINQAIKEAVNEDAVLSNLLIVQDGPGNTLNFLTQVETTASQINVSLRSELMDASNNVDADDISSSLLSSWQNFRGDSSLVATNLKAAMDAMVNSDVDLGTALTTTSADSSVTVNAGAGNDVIVLGTGAADTVVLEGSNFGTNSIVNFTVTTTPDQLDFTSYLNTQTNGNSPSSVSNEDIAVTFNTATTAAANSVSTLTFTANADDSWADVTVARLIEALNGGTGADDLGTSITSTSLSTVGASAFGTGATDIASSTADYIVMVENTANLGEYKVFKLTSTETSGDDFTTSGSSLVGTLDFGATLTGFANANLVDFA